MRPYLYVGGVAPTHDPDALAALRVTHVVSLLAGATASSPSSSLSSSSSSMSSPASSGGGAAAAAAGVAASLSRRFVHAPVELADDGGVPLAPAVAAVAAAVAAARAAGGGVYVHCYRGVSRSAAAAVGYLMAAEGCTYEEGLAAVRRGRSIADPNGGFVEQLQRGVGVVVGGGGKGTAADGGTRGKGGEEGEGHGAPAPMETTGGGGGEERAAAVAADGHDLGGSRGAPASPRVGGIAEAAAAERGG